LHDKGHTQTDFNQTNERTGRNDNCRPTHRSKTTAMQEKKQKLKLLQYGQTKELTR